MEVCIIDRELNHNKKYQIMVRTWCGYNHVFQGKLFTLDEAKKVCAENGYTVIAVGDIWQCAV